MGDDEGDCDWRERWRRLWRCWERRAEGVEVEVLDAGTGRPRKERRRAREGFTDGFEGV